MLVFHSCVSSFESIFFVYSNFEQISKYIVDNGNKVSHCQKRKLQIQKEKKISMNSVELDWN